MQRPGSSKPRFSQSTTASDPLVFVSSRYDSYEAEPCSAMVVLKRGNTGITTGDGTPGTLDKSVKALATMSMLRALSHQKGWDRVRWDAKVASLASMSGDNQTDVDPTVKRVDYQEYSEKLGEEGYSAIGMDEAIKLLEEQVDGLKSGTVAGQNPSSDPA
jgi:hypothetical protein